MRTGTPAKSHYGAATTEAVHSSDSHIGKESNLLEDVEAGLIHSVHGVYTEYTDPRRDEWIVKIIPALKQVPFPELLEKSGMSRSALLEVLAGRSRPHRRNQKRLTEIARELGLIQ